MPDCPSEAVLQLTSQRHQRAVREAEEDEAEYTSVRDYGWAHHIRTKPEREARERRRVERGAAERMTELERMQAEHERRMADHEREGPYSFFL